MKKNVLVGGMTSSGKTIFSHRLVDGFDSAPDPCRYQEQEVRCDRA